jgi:hypothetical protein
VVTKFIDPCGRRGAIRAARWPRSICAVEVSASTVSCVQRRSGFIRRALGGEHGMERVPLLLVPFWNIASVRITGVLNLDGTKHGRRRLRITADAATFASAGNSA